MRWCLSSFVSNHLKQRRCWRCLRFLRCIGALLHPISITLTTKWTSDGLSVTPEVQQFDDLNEVNIIYSYNTNTSGKRQESNTDQADIENKKGRTPLLGGDKTDADVENQNGRSIPLQITKPYSQRPHTLEGIDNTWQGILTATASDGRYNTQCQIPVEREFDVDRFKKDLSVSYMDRFEDLVLFPWRERFQKAKNMNDIYVQQDLEMSASSEEATRGRTNKRRSVRIRKEELFLLKHGHVGTATRIVLKGLVGIGKSSLLCKLVYDWATDSNSLLNKFQLVFLLRMTHMGDNKELVEAIREQIIALADEAYIGSLGLSNYLKQNQEKILILMDGWDETSIANIASNRSYEGTMTIEQILACRQLPETCVIVSTRPHKPLGTIQSRYVSIHVRGFSGDNREKYIRSFFSSEKDLDIGGYEAFEKFITELQRSPVLLALSRIPLILTLLCTVWIPNQHFSNTLYDLYQTFVDTIVERYNHACQGDETRKQLEESEAFQLNLGEVALEGLLSNTNIQNDIVEFSEDKFGAPMCSLGLGVGLLRKEWRLITSEKKVICFLHESFQGFFAGKYLAKLLDSKPTENVDENEFCTKLKEIKTWDLVLQKLEVLKFCCGASQSAATTVIDHVIRIFSSEYRTHNAEPEIECGVDHAHDHMKSEISVGAEGGKQPDCLPILTLLQESKLEDDSVFTDSIFSDMDALSVVIDCDDPQSLPLFKSFTESKIGKETSERIRSISLDMIKLEVDAQDTKLTRGILSRVPNVEHLKIVPNHNVEYSIEPLTRALQDCKQLQSLSFAEAHLNNRHIKTLSTLFSFTTKLRVLDLERNSIGMSIKSLTYHLQHCHQLSVLGLESTELEDAGVTTLANTFKHWPELTELFLGGNDVGNTGLDAVLSNIHQLPKLTRLEIQFTTIDSQCSPLVKKCLHAIGEKTNADGKTDIYWGCIRWNENPIDLTKLRCISIAASTGTLLKRSTRF
ncbi:NLR family CARD domain-containing protein 4-like [Amphiura filiformis]|uniref:NLR family CARD domain-containing protein 4-like n=1 Tax=Amphiura filiformis TaxID=82378 RepID=UPI003B21C475